MIVEYPRALRRARNAASPRDRHWPCAVEAACRNYLADVLIFGEKHLFRVCGEFACVRPARDNAFLTQPHKTCYFRALDEKKLNRIN
jgi:hypothetical protein